MLKTLKSKILLTFGLVASIIVGAVGFAMPKQKTVVLADSQNIKVEFGSLNLNKKDDFDQSSPKYPNIANGDVILLDTNSSTSVNNAETKVEQEALKVSFKLQGPSKIVVLQEFLTLNGIRMDTEKDMSVDETENSTYTQYLFYNKELKTSMPTGTQKTFTQNQLQGKYTYTFKYTTDTSDTMIEESFSFYLIFKNNYLNNRTTTQTTNEPILYNTNKIFRYVQQDTNKKFYSLRKSDTDENFSYVDKREQNYYNFNNSSLCEYSTIEKDRENTLTAQNENNSPLKHPTYTYDASRYNISWEYSLNGITTIYTTKFVVENNIGYVYIYKNGEETAKIETTKTEYTLTSEKNDETNNKYSNSILNNQHFFVNIVFDQVGEYNFKVLPVVAIASVENPTQADIEYVVIDSEHSSNLIDKEFYIFGDVKLDIFGYELFYTDYNNGAQSDLQFKTIVNNTIVNADITNNYSTLNSVPKKSAETLFIDNFDERVQTNQAPVSFAKYLANMSMSGATSNSYVLYYKTPGSTPTFSDITNSTKFSNNGYYIVVVKYNYQYYTVFNTLNGKIENKANLSDEELFYQVFAFRINNVEPEVTITTTDGENFSSGAITKQDISFEWLTTNLFDVNPSIVVNYKFDRDGNYTPATDQMVEQNEEDGDNTIILKALDNKVIYYQLILQYGPNKNTKVFYNFITDTTPITSTAFEIEQETSTEKVDNVSYENKYFKSNTLANELTDYVYTSKDFYVSFTNTKDSGATVSSSYMFIPLVSGNNSPATFDATNTSNFKYIYNGMKLDNNFATYNYLSAQTTNVTINGIAKEFLLGTSANCVLTTSGYYIFKFEDSAGNVNFKTILVDKSQSLLLIDNNLKDVENGDGSFTNIENYSVLTSAYSIFLDSVNVVYGENKIIDISAIANNTSITTFYNNTTPIEISNKTTINNTTYAYFKNTFNISYSALPKNLPTALKYQTGSQYVYGYTLNLKSTQDETLYSLNISSNGINSAEKKIKLSCDNSLLTATHFDAEQSSLTTTNSANYPTIVNEFETTKDNVLYFSWVNNSGDYAIGDLTLEYRPLTYDLDSPYYPYSANPTTTTDLLNNNTPSTNNNQNDLTYTNFSIPFKTDGMYQITRTYAKDVPSGSLDMKTRKYIFFVDRNKIFDIIELSANNFVIGNIFEIIVSENVIPNYQQLLTAENFAKNDSGKQLFSTNKLPVIFNTKQINVFKYAQKDTSYTNANANTDFALNIHTNSINGKTTWLSQIKNTFALTVETKRFNNSYNTNTFTTAGMYDIEITDNSCDYSKISHTLSFEINMVQPKASFIKPTSNNYSELDEPIINNYENLKLAWKDSNDEFTAIINPSKVFARFGISGDPVDVSNYVENCSLTDFDHMLNLENLFEDYNLGNQDTYVEITLEYYNNKGYDAYRNTFKMYLDFTAPDLNFNRLLNADNYLTNSQKLTFNDYTSLVNFENYAFTINKDFSFESDSNPFNGIEGFETNTVDIYYRHYDKYQPNTNPSRLENLQSLISSDSRYNQLNSRMKFSKVFDDWNRIQFGYISSTINFYEEVKNSVNPFGYYEIIEIDKAGNERIYSIYLPKDQVFEIDIQTSGKITTEENIIVNAEDFEVTTLTADKAFYNLYIYKNGSLLQLYKISPIELDGFISIEQAKQIINSYSTQVDNSGIQYTFNLQYSSILNSGETSTVNKTITYNHPSDKILPEFTVAKQGNGSKTLLYISWENNASTYIENVEIFESETTGFVKLFTDMNSEDINSTDSKGNFVNKTFVFDATSGKAYKVVFTDNFGRNYSKTYTVGLTDIAELEYFGTFIEQQDIVYTANQVSVTYQPKLYSIEVYEIVDGVQSEEPIELNNIIKKPNGVLQVLIFNNLTDVTTYKIIVKQSADEGLDPVINATITYVPILGEVVVKDNGGETMFSSSTTNPSMMNIVSKSCYIYVDNSNQLPNIPTRVYATRTFENETFNIGLIENGQCLSDTGIYTLTITNDLNLTKILKFEIRDAISKDFSVITSSNKELTSSDVYYQYAGNSIEWFFTVEEYGIDTSSGRFTTVSLVEEMDNGATKIYKLTGTNNNNQLNEKYIAVTKVAFNPNFIKNSLSMNNSTITGSQKTFSSNVVTLRLEKAYNEFEGNTILVNYSFNQGELISAPLTNEAFSFKQAGVYDFYFTDLAGNIQIFNNKQYFRVFLFNEVVIKVNNSQKLQNQVFNGNVSIRVEESSQYKALSVEVTKNGRPFIVNRINNLYTFTEFGVYSVTFKGDLLDTAQTVTTTYNFTILNEQQSYVAYEYTAGNGCEIVKIEKDGEDITKDILSALSMQQFNNPDLLLNSITYLKLSGNAITNFIGGNGKYKITVLERNANPKLNATFSFNVWINSGYEVFINPSINVGTSSSKPINLQINTSQIFDKIGMCNITINGKVWLAINNEGKVTSYMSASDGVELVQSATTNLKYSTYRLTANKEYNIKIETLSNNTIMSFTVTKTEPLNGTAILVIVIIIIAITAIVTLFLLLRKKMRVK